MFQSYAFQPLAFQTVLGAATSGGSPYTYIPAFQLREIHQKKEIVKKKTELQKVQSVISEYERRRELAEESLRIAQETERNRLLKTQNELITEITRLLMVKAELVARIKRDEEMLILMITMRRRRFRAF